MNAANNLPAEQKVTFSLAINKPAYKELINRTLTDPKRAARFVAAITSAVAVNPALQACTPPTILAGALLGESLNLSPSPQLGQYYLVPFKNKTGGSDASFIIGWKGLLQLMIRSGAYKRINVNEIKQGELKKWNPFTEEFEAEPIMDANERDAAPTIGYVASFEYLNGFVKTLYWSYEQMLNHADRYSKAFSKTAYEKLINGGIPENEKWKYSSFWYKDFDAMAKKTMLRQLSKYGIMSTEMQMAFEHDDSVNNIDNGNVVFGTPEAMEAAGVEGEDITPTDLAKEQTPTYAEAKAINFNEVK